MHIRIIRLISWHKVPAPSKPILYVSLENSENQTCGLIPVSPCYCTYKGSFANMLQTSSGISARSNISFTGSPQIYIRFGAGVGLTKALYHRARYTLVTTGCVPNHTGPTAGLRFLMRTPWADQNPFKSMLAIGGRGIYRWYTHVITRNSRNFNSSPFYLPFVYRPSRGTQLHIVILILLYLCSHNPG